MTKKAIPALELPQFKVKNNIIIRLNDGRTISIVDLLKRLERVESALADYIILGDSDDKG